jgi:hypothetical protein
MSSLISPPGRLDPTRSPATVSNRGHPGQPNNPRPLSQPVPRRRWSRSWGKHRSDSRWTVVGMDLGRSGEGWRDGFQHGLCRGPGKNRYTLHNQVRLTGLPCEREHAQTQSELSPPFSTELSRRNSERISSPPSRLICCRIVRTMAAIPALGRGLQCHRKPEAPACSSHCLLRQQWRCCPWRTLPAKSLQNRRRCC